MQLIEKITSRQAKIGIIGLGYVGLPLVVRFCEEGFEVIGFDIDPQKVKVLNGGRSYIESVRSVSVKEIIRNSLFSATDDMSLIRDVDAVIICVPTPLTDKREPDLHYVEQTAVEISKYLSKGAMVVLESTTYPGTTEEVLEPLLDRGSMKAGKDYYLVYSPEREDPGRNDYSTKTIPKIVSGITSQCAKAGEALYSAIVDNVVKVSSTRAAEMTKLLENIYRSVNISLVNELKVLCDRMDIDVWEVIEAAGTKPFGFQPFYPGPGLGGHCIPIDPFYLTWKAREYDFSTRFIELAGEINVQMPRFVAQKLVDSLNDRKVTIKGARVLIMGVAYKKDINDTRESPALKIIDILQEKGAKVDYHDPHIPVLTKTRKYNFKKKSISLSEQKIKQYDGVIIVTDHSSIDYSRVLKCASLIIDTRNAIKRKSKKVVKA